MSNIAKIALINHEVVVAKKACTLAIDALSMTMGDVVMDNKKDVDTLKRVLEKIEKAEKNHANS